MLSIIIPTYNEEKCLSELLESIKKQYYKDYEIIVADNKSKDKTEGIAKKYGCKVVKGGLPAIARNNGAKAAKGDIFLFLDADDKLDDGFLEKSIGEFKRKNLDLATCYFKVKGNKLVDKIIFSMGNVFLFLYQFVEPHACGYAIFCTKSIFKKLNGFKDDLKMSEDEDFAKRGGKIGRFRILNVKNQVNVRRFEKEGRLKVLFEYLKTEIYRKFKGDIKKELFEYDYDKH